VEYRFILLDTQDVNAFSHLGGFVYVSLGLFNLVADDAELQFVLAHEVAHVDQKHAAERVEAAAREEAVDRLGLVRRGDRQVALGYADGQDFAADAGAFGQLARLGHSRRKCLAFLRRYRNYAEHNGLAAGHRRTPIPPEADVQDVMNHWPAHPAAAV